MPRHGFLRCFATLWFLSIIAKLYFNPVVKPFDQTRLMVGFPMTDAANIKPNNQTSDTHENDHRMYRSLRNGPQRSSS